MFARLATHVPRLTAGLFPDLLWRVPTERRRAYLTFDDGPTEAATSRLLDVLARHDVRATFFLVGAHAAARPGLVRAIRDAGHAIGNHTYTHPDAWRIDTSRLVAELERTTATLEDLTGAPVRLLRPPYGRFTRTMRAWARTRRQRMVMWDVVPADWLARTTQAQIEARVETGIRPGSIVVLHDNPTCCTTTPAAVDALLGRLRGEGWSFPAL